MTLSSTIANLRSEWSQPRLTSDSDPSSADFKVACSFVDGGNTESIAGLPDDLAEFWTHYDGARLFEDREYGQWGLKLLSLAEANAQTDAFRMQRSGDFRDGDLVVGQFLGDSDVLIVRCDPTASDFGNVVVALPLDGRVDWDRVGISLADFLHQYAEAEGAKFWE